MRILKPLSHSKLSTTQIHFFTLNLLDFIAPFREKDPLLNNQYKVLERSCDAIGTLLSLSRKNAKTKELLDTDNRQDQLLRGIRDYLKGLCAISQFDKERAVASEKVLKIIQSFGRDLFYGSYTKQAALISSFIHTMREPAWHPVLESAGITHMINELEETYTRVQNIHIEKLEAAVRPNTSIKKEKRVLQYRISLLLPYLEIHLADRNEAYLALEEPLNNLITDVMKQYHAKISRKNKQETDIPPQ